MAQQINRNAPQAWRQPEDSPAPDYVSVVQPRRGKRTPEPGSPMAECVVELRRRCLAFGLDVTEPELTYAGLLLLLNQSETALEVAMLQSLRGDRSTQPRKSGRR